MCAQHVSDHFIVLPFDEQNAIRAWSTRRLSYPPYQANNDWQRDFKKAICVEGATLQSKPGQVLQGIYESSLKQLCDVENVLFYNVQENSSCFAGAAKYGVRFERAYSHPIQPESSAVKYPHYHCYALVDINEGFRHWREGQPLAEWTDVKFPQLSSNTKPALIWHKVLSHPLDSIHVPDGTPVRFGLRATASIPSAKTVNILSVMKPLLDGLIAAFHVHDGAKIDELSQRLSLALGIDAANIAQLLQRTDRAVLGQRKLLWPRDKGVQWNPGDDHCLAGELLVRTHNSNSWLISGRLFEILEKGDSR